MLTIVQNVSLMLVARGFGTIYGLLDSTMVFRLVNVICYLLFTSSYSLHMKLIGTNISQQNLIICCEMVYIKK